MTTAYGNERSEAWHLPEIDWNAVTAGVAVALIAQLMLALLGIGLGLASVDTSDVTDETGARTALWTGYAWWAVSGIIAAFVGGYVAGSVARRHDITKAEAATQGFITWSLSILIIAHIMMLSAAAGAGGLAGGLAGPLPISTGSASENDGGQTVDRRMTAGGSTAVRNAAPSAAAAESFDSSTESGGPLAAGDSATVSAAEQVRREAATGALLSFFALAIGALAAMGGAVTAAPNVRSRAVANTPVRP